MSFILRERKRIADRSRIGDVVFGSQDGITTTLCILSSFFGATQDTPVILIAGFSATVAGMFSMGAGSYLSSRAEAEVHRSEIKKEARKIKDEPEDELAELVKIYERHGMSHRLATEAAHAVMKKPRKVLELMAHIELGIEPHPKASPVNAALLMAGSYVVGGIIPLLPYLLFQGRTAFVVSVSAGVVALFCVGFVKGKIAESNALRSGAETFLLGSIAAALGFVVGTLIPKALGVHVPA
jgi:vacuolar iron transporter family protein